MPQIRTALVEEQHGFVKGRSTATNAVLYTEFLLEVLERCERKLLLIYRTL